MTLLPTATSTGNTSIGNTEPESEFSEQFHQRKKRKRELNSILSEQQMNSEQNEQKAGAKSLATPMSNTSIGNRKSIGNKWQQEGICMSNRKSVKVYDRWSQSQLSWSSEGLVIQPKAKANQKGLNIKHQIPKSSGSGF